MTPYYNTQFFIDKFEAIPDEKWMTKFYSDGEGRKCALGHCGIASGWLQGSEADSLIKLLASLGTNPADVNDGHDARYKQETPKQRIIAALRDVVKNGR